MIAALELLVIIAFLVGIYAGYSISKTEKLQMTAQVFNIPDRTQPSTYDRQEDLATVYVLGKGVQDRIDRQLLHDEEDAKRTAELALVGIATGEGFYCNTVKVTGP